VTEEKVHENRIRRMASRQGYRLTRSRRRDPYAKGFGLYDLVDANGKSVMAGETEHSFRFELDQIERFLTRKGGTVKFKSAGKRKR
jgi:hypothetical protein